MPHSFLWLNDNQVDKLLDPAAAYRSVRGAFECHARKDYQQPLKPYVRLSVGSKSTKAVATSLCLASLEGRSRRRA